MKILYRNTKVIGTAPDEAITGEDFLIVPDDIEIDYVRLAEYRVVNNTLTLPTNVPAEVTKRQGRQALLLANKLHLVQPVLDAIADDTQRAMMQIEWDDSQSFLRSNTRLIAIATALGLDSEGIDQLFITASTL